MSQRKTVVSLMFVTAVAVVVGYIIGCAMGTSSDVDASPVKAVVWVS